MRNDTTKRLTQLALLTALSVVLGYFVRIPTPTGMLTLLDAGIFFTAFSLGKKEGAIVGGVSAFLIDILAGFPQWMVISLLAHGLQGYFAGEKGKIKPIALVLSCLSMVGVYFIAAGVLYGFVASLADILGNVAQTVSGLVIGFFAYKAYKKTGI